MGNDFTGPTEGENTLSPMPVPSAMDALTASLIPEAFDSVAGACRSAREIVTSTQGFVIAERQEIAKRFLERALAMCDTVDEQNNIVTSLKEAATDKEFKKRVDIMAMQILEQQTPMSQDPGLTIIEIIRPVLMQKGIDLPDLPEASKMPPGYALVHNGRDYEVVKLSQNSDGTERQKTIAPFPIFVKERIINVDDRTEKWRVAYWRLNKWEEIAENREVFMKKASIIDLSAKGFPVSEDTAKDVIKFLTEYHNYNSDVLPTQYGVERCGWKEINGARVFAAGSHIVHHSSDIMNVELMSHPDLLAIMEAYQPRGELQEWVDQVFKPALGFTRVERHDQQLELVPNRDTLVMAPRVLYPKMAAMIFASFVGLFTDIIETNNEGFMVHNYGTSSKGKSTALRVSASVWGNPKDGALFQSWNATTVFLERLAALSDGTCLYLDESSNANERAMVTNIYVLTNGLGKGRGSPGVKKMERTQSWKLSIISNGEMNIGDISENTGIKPRVLPLYGPPMAADDAHLIEHLRRAVHHYYGQAGVFVAKRLTEMPQKDIDYLRTSYDYRVDHFHRMVETSQISEDDRSIADRLGRHFALLSLIGDFLMAHLQIFAHPDTIPELTTNEHVQQYFRRVQQTAFIAMRDLFKESVQRMLNGSYAEKAMTAVIDWSYANRPLFHGISTDDRAPLRGWAGHWDTTGDILSLFPSQLERVLDERKYALQVVLTQWKENGWLITLSGQPYKNRVVTFGDGRGTFMYSIDLSRLPKTILS